MLGARTREEFVTAVAPTTAFSVGFLHRAALPHRLPVGRVLDEARRPQTMPRWSAPLFASTLDTWVEEAGMNALFGDASPHPLAAFGPRHAGGAARLRGDRAAIAEAGEGASNTALDYRQLDRVIAAFASRAANAVRPGDRVMIVGAQRTGVVAAVFGALAAGVELVVAHCMGRARSHFWRRRPRDSSVCAFDVRRARPESIMRWKAADAPEIRFIGSLGPGEGRWRDRFRRAVWRTRQKRRNRRRDAPTRHA